MVAFISRSLLGWQRLVAIPVDDYRSGRWDIIRYRINNRYRQSLAFQAQAFKGRDVKAVVLSQHAIPAYGQGYAFVVIRHNGHVPVAHFNHNSSCRH